MSGDAITDNVEFAGYHDKFLGNHRMPLKRQVQVKKKKEKQLNKGVKEPILL